MWSDESYKKIFFPPLPVLQKEPLGFHSVVTMKALIGHMSPSHPLRKWQFMQPSPRINMDHQILGLIIYQFCNPSILQP